MFDTGSLMLQLGYALLIGVAAVSRKPARILLALFAILFLWAAIRLGDWVTVAWMALLLAASLLLLARDVLADRRARFSTEEEAMLAGFLAGVPRHLARHLIDGGVWLNGTMGDEITREGVAVERVAFLASGEALVLSDGRQVATCRTGDLIGEASVLSGEPATATVRLAGPARFWCMPAETLRTYLEADPELRTMLERSFGRAVRNKLHASNRTIAAAGGIA